MLPHAGQILSKLSERAQNFEQNGVTLRSGR